MKHKTPFYRFCPKVAAAVLQNAKPNFGFVQTMLLLLGFYHVVRYWKIRRHQPNTGRAAKAQRVAKLGWVLSIWFCWPQAIWAASYSVGIVPQQAAEVLAVHWMPLLRHAAVQSGVELHFKTAPNIPEFERRLASGEYDFAYMNPYHYAFMFSGQAGYSALAKEKNRRLQGVVVVRKDNPIERIEQLDGLDLALPAPAAFAASVLVRMQLNALGIGVRPHFVASHDSVYQSVAQGIYPAGGGVVRTLNAAPEAIRQQLRVLSRTESVTPHAFAAHSRVAEAARTAVANALIAMEQTPNAAEILRKMDMQGWEAANDSDWDDLRNMPINRDMVEVEEVAASR